MGELKVKTGTKSDKKAKGYKKSAKRLEKMAHDEASHHKTFAHWLSVKQNPNKKRATKSVVQQIPD